MTRRSKRSVKVKRKATKKAPKPRPRTNKPKPRSRKSKHRKQKKGQKRGIRAGAPNPTIKKTTIVKPSKTVKEPIQKTLAEKIKEQRFIFRGPTLEEESATLD
jgi:hypothetical protein